MQRVQKDPEEGTSEATEDASKVEPLFKPDLDDPLKETGKKAQKKV